MENLTIASVNVFRMGSRLSFIKLHLEIGFSVIHLGLVLALFEKTRNSVKIKPFFGFLPSGILNVAFYLYYLEDF